MNSINLVGNLVKDAESAYTTDDGKECINFTMACERTVKENGQWVQKAEYIECVYYAKSTLMAMMMKGKLIAVQGYWKTQKWQDKATGDARKKVIVGVTSLKVYGNKNDDQGSMPSRPQSNSGGQAPYQEHAEEGWNKANGGGGNLRY